MKYSFMVGAKHSESQFSLLAQRLFPECFALYLLLRNADLVATQQDKRSCIVAGWYLM